MSLFGRVFGKPGGGEEEEEDDTEVERCLQQISDARHAEDRREAMAQLCTLLKDNMRAQAAIGAMGLPVLLSVLSEDRDDLELLKGAVEVLHLSVSQPEAAAGGNLPQQPGGQQQEAAPPPALINADLLCRAPDNVLLLLGLLRPEPDGCEDFYVRYSALQALGALLAACPDKLQACVLSSPLGVVALMDLLGQPLEVLRNEALLLLVGLCSGCPQIASIAAFEGAFERLLAICRADGGPGGGDVVVQDAAELLNNLLRDNLANQRLFREMGHIQQLPPLLHFAPPQHAQPAQAPAAPSAASGLFSAASQFMDPSLRAAAGAAASAAVNSAVGVAAAAAAAAAGAAAAMWPVQVAANYLCLLETARVLLAAPHAGSEEERAQEAANRRANQDALGQLGLMPLLVALSIPGAPSPAVRAQALFCLGDLVWGHPELQEQLAGHVVPQQQQQQLQHGSKGAQGQQPIPYLQAVLRLLLHGRDDLERAGASHLLQAFCQDNAVGQLAVLSTVAPAAEPHTFGEELLATLLCQQQPGPGAAPGAQHAAGQHGSLSPTKGGGPGSSSSSSSSELEAQLAAGRAALALSYLLQHNPGGQHSLLTLQLGPAPAAHPAGTLPPVPPPGAAAAAAGAPSLVSRIVALLAEGARRQDGQALPVCYSVLRLLITWCAGCGAAVAALLGNASHLPLLVDLVGGRLPAGDVHTAGLAAVLLGVCLMYAQGSPVAAAQQPQLHAQLQRVGMPPPRPPPPGGGGPSFDQLLDVLLSRVGLSQFVGAVDGMTSSAAFRAAATAPRLPAHITRSMAGALLEGEAAGAASAAAAAAAGGRAGAAGSALLGGALGLLSQAADAAEAAGGGGGAAGQQQQQQHQGGGGAEAQHPYDQGFAQQAKEVAAAVQQLTLNAFSGGAGSLSPGAGLAGAPRLPALPSPQQQPQQQQPQVLPPPPTAFFQPQQPQQQPQQQQQQHPSLPSILPPPPSVLPPPPAVPSMAFPAAGAAAAAGGGGGLTPPGSATPLAPPGSTAAGAAAGAAGTAAAAAAAPSPAIPAAAAAGTPPGAAAPTPPPPQQQPPQQQAPLQALQAQLQAAPGGEALAGLLAQLPGDTLEHRLLASLEALLQLQAAAEELRSRNRSLAEDLIRVSQAKPGLGSSGGAAANGGPHENGLPPDGSGGGGAAGDADARVAAQLRASRAELEAGALRQQLASMQERWSALEGDVAAAHEAAEEARAAAATAQADLAALSSAYNDLEGHAFGLEEQLKQQQEQQQQEQQQQVPAAGPLAEAEVQARIQAAVEQDRQQRPDAAQGGGSGDVDARIAAAAEEARAAAAAEAGEEMEDLLACLGEEQAKVEVLSGRLAELGEDVDVLLAALTQEGKDDDGEEGEGAQGGEEELL